MVKNGVYLFQRPCPPGWIYPCSLADIECSLAEIPEQDLKGLWAVGLVPSTRKDCYANGQYLFGDKPVIHLFSYPEMLSFKQPPHIKPGQIAHGLAVELAYGMRVEQVGSRFVCVWEKETLQSFIVDHVLVHEIGHHVYHRRRRQQGYSYCPNRTESEQFAEAYALRLSR